MPSSYAFRVRESERPDGLRRSLPNLGNASAVHKLSAADLRHFRAVLHEQREFRMEQLAELDGRHEGDDAFSEVTASLRAGARFALAEIDAALARMDAGRYGLCVNCDRAIPLERLEVIPMTALCMPCQVAAETRRGVP